MEHIYLVLVHGDGDIIKMNCRSPLQNGNFENLRNVPSHPQRDGPLYLQLEMILDSKSLKKFLFPLHLLEVHSKAIQLATKVIKVSGTVTSSHLFKATWEKEL